MKTFRIAIDAMGGDNYPGMPVAGAIYALNQLPADFIIQLVGDNKLIKRELSGYTYDHDRISIIPATDVISMQASPLFALRRQRHSSIHVGIMLQQQGFSDAFVSAGNTGAIVAVARLFLRTNMQPALACIFPTKNGACIGLDMGANAETTAAHLAQFGIMGSLYSHHIMDIVHPRVALMSIGSEMSKGNHLIKDAGTKLLSLHEQQIINFMGHVEGNDLFSGKADVIVFPGYTGNVVLKVAESVLPTLNEALKRKLRNSSFIRKLFALFAKITLAPTIASLKRDFDYQKYGGAPLLGIKGIVIKAHGRSTPVAMYHAIEMARRAALQKLYLRIEQHTADYTTLINQQL